MYLRKISKLLKSRKINEATLVVSSKNTHRNISKHFKEKIPSNYGSSDIKCCQSFPNIVHKQFYSTSEDPVDTNTFERVCEETLTSLAEYFEDLVATDVKLEKADVMYGVGVLTIDLGTYGTYVINRQSPNKQIWLSSPSSGPKRFDYLMKDDCWVYKHNGQTLHGLLKREFEIILGRELQLSKCLHSDL